MSRLIAPNRQGQRGDRVPWVLGAVCAMTFIAALWAARAAGIEPLRPDTASYLYFDPSRSIGYPMFLWIVRAVSGDAQFAVSLQMLLLAGSLFLLGWSFHNLVHRPALSIGFQLLLLCSPELWKSSASLVTEAVATACVALWCAQILRLVRNASLGGIGILSIITATGVLVRPSLVPLFFGTALFALLLSSKNDRWWAAATVAAALLVSWGLTPLANYFIHGSAATGSPVARGVLQHTLYCTPRTAPQGSDAAFVEHHAAAVRQYIAPAPSDVKPVLRQLYSGELRFGLIIPALGRRHGFQAGWQTDPVIMRIARERVAANPICYGRSALNSYYRLATYATAGAPAQVARIRAFLAANPPVEVPSSSLLPNEERLALKAAAELNVENAARPGQRTYDPPKEKPLILIFGARVLHSSAAVVGLLSLLLLSRRRWFDPDRWSVIVTMASLGLVFHGVLAVTAIVELPLMRYTVPVWPAACTLLGLSAEQLSKWLERAKLRKGEDENRRIA